MDGQLALAHLDGRAGSEGNRRMKFVIAAICACCCVAVAQQATTAPAPADALLRANVLLDGGQVVLPNAWRITPAGKPTQLPGDMPMRMLFAPGGKQLLVSTGGYNQHGI